uniref:Transmembrane protein n=1 Tax=Panagrellus redivivus TaxID=6233 RepID=A0A7E4W616_PANRE
MASQFDSADVVTMSTLLDCAQFMLTFSVFLVTISVFHHHITANASHFRTPLPSTKPNLLIAAGLTVSNPGSTRFKQLNMANWKQRNDKRQQLQLRRTQQLNAWNERHAPEQAVESQMNDDNSFLVLIDNLINDERTKWLLLFLAGYIPIFYIAYLWNVFSIGNGIFNIPMMLFFVVVSAYDAFGIWYFQKR